LLLTEYNFFVGKAEYIANPQLKAWEAVVAAHREVDSVLQIEQRLTRAFGERKFSFETRGKQTVKVYSVEFSKAYHKALNGMVERQMRGAVKMIGDFWYSAWLDAGQPDVKELMTYQPTDAELEQRRKEAEELKRQRVNARMHEHEN
jgi:protein tyrosine phosphatase